MTKALQVSDRPAEIWIKLLFFITAIAVALTAYMGDRVIQSVDRTTEEVSKINVSISSFDDRISRNERDIRELEKFNENIKIGAKGEGYGR